MSWHLLSKSTEPFRCASHLAQLAIHKSSSCQHIRSLGHFCSSPAGPVADWRYRIAKAPPPFLFNSVMPTFTSLLLSTVSSAFPWPGFRRQSFAFACLPSRPNDLLLWLTTSFAEAGKSVKCCRGTAELSPWLLDTQGHTTRFAHSPAVHRFFPGFPASAFCLPQSGSAFPMCRRARRCCCLC